MPPEPNLEDYESLIKAHLAKLFENATRALRDIEAKARMHGRSGRVALVLSAVVLEEFEKGLELALTELKRVSKRTQLDGYLLRQSTGRLLSTFQEDLTVAAKPYLTRAFMGAKAIEGELGKLEALRQSKLRFYDIGLFDPSEPAANSNVSNHLSIGVMSGGAVQQGTVGSKQTQLTINHQDISDALHAFERALSAISLSEEHRKEAAADISTIKAQLEKAHPSTTILRETGKSLRNICEGAVGGALSGPALSALWKMLGL
ncbi:hypothetical protein ACO2I3_01915 [Leptospira interrogans]